VGDFKLITSESVSEGHPDKVADQISDAILDECLRCDPESRTAIETLLGMGFAVITGEIKTEGYVDMTEVVRNTIIEVGYTDPDLGLDGRTCGVLVSVHEQSEDIGIGVDSGGAGDQGMMFGYACDETPELMPLPIALAHAIMRQHSKVRRECPELGFRPDGKCQVTIRYEGGKPKAIHTIVCSCQHEDKLSRDEVKERVLRTIIRPALEKYRMFVDVPDDIQCLINPTGRFVRGGPTADSGLTGRKIIVDTYGGFCPHGGGAFSGKDPTKVDRSGAYMARHVAKCIVSAGLARKVQISLAYAIGLPQPIHISVETFGTETMAVEKIEEKIKSRFDFRPREIAKYLGLRSPNIKYLPTAKNGHFGHPEFPWENTDAAKDLL